MEAAAGKSKLEEQATAKADLSYSYWAANTASAPPLEPKKLTGEEVEQQASQAAAQSGASAWNAAGTFEERSVPLDWVKERLAALVQGLESRHGGAALRVARLAACSGEAHQWIVRGKRRAGFELDLTLDWEADVGGAPVSGTARVPQAAADELDEMELEVTLSSSTGNAVGGAAAAAGEEQRAAAKGAAQGLLPQLQAALEELIEVVKGR